MESAHAFPEDTENASFIPSSPIFYLLKRGASYAAMLWSPQALLNTAHPHPNAKEMPSRFGIFFFPPTVPQKQTAFVNFELFLLGVFYDGERLVPSEDEKSLKKWQSPVCRC